MARREVIASTLLALSLMLASLATAAGNVVVAWNNTTLEAIRMTHPGPPMVARMLAIVHTCMYDAWAAYDTVAVSTRLGGTLRRPVNEHSDENKAQAISFAAQRCLKDLFPTEQSGFAQLMIDLGYNPADDSVDPTSPTGIGNRAAQSIIGFSASRWRQPVGGPVSRSLQ